MRWGAIKPAVVVAGGPLMMRWAPYLLVSHNPQSIILHNFACSLKLPPRSTRVKIIGCIPKDKSIDELSEDNA